MRGPRFDRSKRYINKYGKKFGKGVWYREDGAIIKPGWGVPDSNKGIVTQYNSDGTVTSFTQKQWHDKKTKEHEYEVLQNDRKYAIPFIPSKKMTITIDKNSPTRKNASAVISENLLDSIAANASKARIPFSTALGITAQESTLGNSPSRSVGKTMLPWFYVLNNSKGKLKDAAMSTSYDNVQSPSLLISNWKEISENPFAAYHYDSQGNLRKESRSIDYYKDDFIPSVRKNNRYKIKDTSPLFYGFREYKKNPNKYNPRDPDYPNKVEAQKNELINYSPEIKAYMKKHNLKAFGGSLNSSWDFLSYKDKAEMMKVAIANGITTLPEIKNAYNEYAKGGKINNWTIDDEVKYRNWRSKLPKNLRETNDNDYDMRAAYKAGMQPMWNDIDKSYHLESRDPQSGRILKSAHHPTFMEALSMDQHMGYYPYTDKTGNTYTKQLLNIEYPLEHNLYPNGGELLKGFGFTKPSLIDDSIKPIETIDDRMIEKPKVARLKVEEPTEWINPNTQNTSTLEAFTNYLNSPIIRKRLNKMYAKEAIENYFTPQEYTDMMLQDMKQTLSDTSIVKKGIDTTANIGKRVITIGTEQSPGITNINSGTLSHELGHLMYPSGDDNWGLNNIHTTAENAKRVYGNKYNDNEYIDKGYDSVIGHDNDIKEKIPFVYETREDMRKLGIWDYTNGDDLTPEKWKQYKESHPNSRLGNYTNDANAINLLNTIAYNNFPQDILLQDAKGNMLAYGGNLFSKGGNLKVLSNSRKAMRYLLANGMNETGASAIIGTLQSESGLDPTIRAKMKGDDGEGLAQWTGSRKKSFWKVLEKIEPGAQKKYGNIVNVPLERQLDVVLNERPDITKAINNAKDIHEATDLMLRGYENGGGKIKSLASKDQINRIYGKWNNGYDKQYQNRLNNANKLLGIMSPEDYEIPQTFLDDINNNLNASMNINNLNNSSDVDPTTLYTPIDVDALRSSLIQPTETNNTFVYNPNQEKTEGLQRLNSAMIMLSQPPLFGNQEMNNDTGKMGIMDYMNMIYNN